MADLTRKTANLWDFYPEQTYGGVTLSWDGEKISYSGTCTTAYNFQIGINLKAGTYTLKANANRNPIYNVASCIDIYRASPFLMVAIENRAAVKGSRTFTIDEDTNVILRIRLNEGVNYDGFEIRPMLNLGSTPLPYEPYGWVHSLRKYGTNTDTITTLPADIYADGTNATVGLKGNMSQTGTPTPSSPIQPSECGERTGNLFLQKLTGVTIASSGELVSDVNYDTYIAEVSDGETYTVSNVTGTQVFGFFTTKPTLGTITYNSSRAIFSTPSQTLTIPTGENIKYIGVRYNTGVPNAMFNTGSTPLPYEPYGYKLDVSSGGKNLISIYKMGYRYDNSANEVEYSSANIYSFPAEAEKTYTINWTFPSSVAQSTVRIFGFYQGTAVVTITVMINVNSVPYSFSTNTPIDEYRISVSNQISNVMANEGSTPLPYEPYNRTTTPVYLGEVESTRRAKKLVLDGTENFDHYGSGVFWVKVEDNNAMINGYGVSNSYAFNPVILDVPTTISNNEFCLTSANGRLWIRNTNYSNAGDFKSYLAAQYAAGTPVTVWYVLATETTGIVNEPIRKIGSYADTVSGISIPTITGKDTVDVETALKPSEVELTYTGWHDAYVKEKSRNLLNPSDILYDTRFDTESNPPAFVHNNTLNCSNFIPVTSGGTYLRMLNNVAVGNWFYEFDANKNYLRVKTPGEGVPMEIGADVSYIVFNILKTSDITKYMFARTSTPIPYEPYWK